MKSYLITGGSHGIGEAIVHALLQDGHRVINVDRQKLEGVNTKHYVFIEADLSKKETIKAVALKLKKEVLDGAILNVGIMDQVTFEDLDFSEVERVLNVNLLSNFFFAKAFAEGFSRTAGRIIFMSSTRALMSEANTLAYSMSKGAIESLVHSLAVTLKDKDITVNAIRPGWIHTSDDEVLKEEDHAFHLSKRVGLKEDIVKAVRYILDEGNTFLNAEIVTVDGGVSKTMIYPEEA